MTKDPEAGAPMTYFDKDFELPNDRLGLEGLKEAFRTLLEEVFTAFVNDSEWGVTESGVIMRFARGREDSWFTDDLPIDIKLSPDDLVTAFEEMAELMEEEPCRAAIARW